MRIFQLTPGSGNLFYCENCLRDSSLIQQFRKLGHDALTVPLYLPVELAEPDTPPQSPLFMGGINVFLQQKFSFFRRFSPRWLDRVFDSRRLLRKLARDSHAVDAAQLAQTTVSMLQGENGKQAKEINRLADWLASQKPDVVCLSNALLLGLVPLIKQRVKCAVACFFQDEDEFIDAMPEPYPEEIWNLIAQHARQVDALIAVSAYYARFVQQRLRLSEASVHVISPGIAIAKEPSHTISERPCAIGYLSRISPGKGLDLLVDAFIKLKQQKRFNSLKLIVAGGHTASHESYFRSIADKLTQAQCQDDIVFLRHFDYAARRSFFSRIQLFCVPEKRPPAYARYALEAVAAAIPIVAPRHGAFIEILAKTNAGLHYDPHSPDALYETLQLLLCDPMHLCRLGCQGVNNLSVHYNLERSAQNMINLFQHSIAAGTGSAEKSF